MHALHLYIKPNILPRQARDKHRETTQKKRPAFHAPQSSSLRTVRRIISSAAWTFRDLRVWSRQDKPVFPPTFWIETIILPKQARDKHRENSPKKSTVFFRSRKASSRRAARRSTSARARLASTSSRRSLRRARTRAATRTVRSRRTTRSLAARTETPLRCSRKRSCR